MIIAIAQTAESSEVEQELEVAPPYCDIDIVSNDPELLQAVTSAVSTALAAKAFTNVTVDTEELPAGDQCSSETLYDLIRATRPQLFDAEISIHPLNVVDFEDLTEDSAVVAF